MRIGGEIINESNPEKLLHRVEKLPSGMEFMKDAVNAAKDMHATPGEPGKSWTSNLKNPSKDHDHGR